MSPSFFSTLEIQRQISRAPCSYLAFFDSPRYLAWHLEAGQDLPHILVLCHLPVDVMDDLRHQTYILAELVMLSGSGYAQ